MRFDEALSGGDRRSTGRADEVAARVLADPAALSELLGCLLADDTVVRMRAGDAIEKVSAGRPEVVTPHAGMLLGLGEAGAEQEMRWHLAQILPRLGLDKAMTARAVALMRGYLDDESRIVRACALSALAAFAEADPQLRAEVGRLLKAAVGSGVPSVQARARKLRRVHHWA